VRQSVDVPDPISINRNERAATSRRRRISGMSYLVLARKIPSQPSPTWFGE
jgi:hypothetical protein